MTKMTFNFCTFVREEILPIIVKPFKTEKSSSKENFCVFLILHFFALYGNLQNAEISKIKNTVVEFIFADRPFLTQFGGI